MKRPWEISRRACLRGAAGTAIGLPLLEAMIPDVKRAQAAGEGTQNNLLFLLWAGGSPDSKNYQDNEGLPGSFVPASAGTGFEITPCLEPLAPLKNDILVVSNLHNMIAHDMRVEGDPEEFRGLDHTRSASGLLTSVNPRYADGNGPGTTAGQSVDQAAAAYLTQNKFAGLPSLVLGNDPGNDIIGTTYSWSAPTTRNRPIIRASEAFGKVFGAPGGDPKALAKQLARRRSVLGYAHAEIIRLNKKLGKADRDTLDGYLTKISSLEQQLMNANPANQCGNGTPIPGDGLSIPDLIDSYTKLVPLAFACDRTRVVVIQLALHGVYFDWLGSPNIDYPLYHDDVEHGGSNTASKDQGARATAYLNAVKWVMAEFGKLVTGLKTERSAAGTALYDNTIAVAASELGYGDGHSMFRLPVVVAGRGGGLVKPGQHLAVRDQPIGNLWVTMLNSIGSNVTSFGKTEGWSEPRHGTNPLSLI